MTTIQYVANNCGLIGPSSASSGQMVTVSVDTLGNVVSEANISITKGDANISFTFNGSTITFFMP